MTMIHRLCISLVSAIWVAGAQPMKPPEEAPPGIPGLGMQPERPTPAMHQRPATSSLTSSIKPGAVVITVGATKIRKRQVDTLVDLMVRARQAQGGVDPREMPMLERMVATNLIGQELLDMEGKRLNMVVSDRELDSLTKAFKTNFPNEEAFTRALAQAGDTEKGLREKMVRQIKSDKLLNSQISPVTKPSPKDVQDFYTGNKASFPINDSLRACQIVFLVDKNASPAESDKKRSNMERLRAELAKDSADVDMLLTRFVLAARQFSDGPEKKDGGDLGRFLPSDFFPEFKKQVAGLKVGQMSQIFRSPMGWHIVLLTERYDGKFESYRLQISRMLVAEKSAKAGKNLRKYLQGLATKYHVSYVEKAYRDTTAAGVYSL